MGVKQVLNLCFFENNLRAWIQPKIAKYCITRVVKKKGNDKIKVAFVVQLSETCWDKQVDIFDEMISNSEFEVKLLVVPKIIEGCISSYENNFFIEKYPNYCIKVVENNKIIKIKNLKFDYVFFPRPYDFYLPKGVRSVDLVKFTRCCYIPYGYSLSDSFNDCNIDSPFFDNIYMEFTESDYIRSLLYKRYKKTCEKSIKHFEYLGYPCLRKYLEINSSSKIETITWTPRWSYDVKHGGSNFIEYKDKFIDFCRKLPRNIKVIFRPHPMMFDELVSKQLITEQDRYEYIEKLNNLNIKIDINSSIDVILKETDLLITDFSSIIIQFFLTKKPIIYCKKNIEFNESGKKLEKFMYETHSWDEVENCCFKLIDGDDVLLTERQKFIEQEFCDIEDSAKKIVDRIIKDYRS